MTTFLLDTSVIIDTLNGKRDRGQLLKQLIHEGHVLACCPIKSLKYYPVTWPAARLAGEIKRDYSRKGITLATSDVTMAAVALHHQLTLITDNVKHYPMKELPLYPLPKSGSFEP